ncbi:MAG TPA: UvrD-helicase domain-containing protein, partial [Candidatus Avacidaminococcus intestinavium]|nr:UvrD-helicase domain-containing protein [Candidatus Avacidaminococcus intestinavium]
MMTNNFTVEQKKAITTIDSNLSVAAGAGSGKTRVLVERFINIIRVEKASADEILAITFTRKAAREMRERIRQSISSLVHEEETRSQYWQNQLRLLERAQINTIDSFCSRILKDNPVEAQMEPGISAAEDFELEEFYREELKTYLQVGLQSKDKALLSLLKEYGVTSLGKMLLSLVEKLPRIVEFGDLSEVYYEILEHHYATLREKIIITLDELEQIYPQIKKGSKHREQLDELFSVIELVKQAVHEADAAVLDKYVGQLKA